MMTIPTEQSEARTTAVMTSYYDKEKEVDLKDVCKRLQLQKVHKVTKLDECEDRMVYLQNKTTLNRIGFDDGLTSCMKGGFFGNQLWQIERDQGDTNFYTIQNISSNKASLFLTEQNVKCDIEDQGDRQLWSFQEKGSGYYQIINKDSKRKLCLTSEGLFGVECGNESDLLWRIVPINYPLVTLFGMGAGKRLARNDGKVCIEGGLVQGKHAWRIFPVDTEGHAEVFYIQNYESGYVLTYSSDPFDDTFDDIRRRWRITQTEDGFINITNVSTEGKLYTVEGEVRCEKDPPDDLRWTLQSPTMKSVYIGCKQTTSGYICLDNKKVWRIHPLPRDLYLLVEAYTGRRVTFDGESLSLTEGPVRDDQMWFFVKDKDKTRYWIENMKFKGQRMYMDNNGSRIYMKLWDRKDSKRTFILRNEIEADLETEQWVQTVSIKDQNFDEEDKMYFGFQGLDLSDEFSVYRVCRNDEKLSEPIRSKDPTSPRKVSQHVASGSTFPSGFISTTLSFEGACHHAEYEKPRKQEKIKRESRLNIIKINLRLLKGTDLEASCINLNVAAVREQFVKSSRHQNYAKSAYEVLFQGDIPTYSFVVLPDQLENQFAAMNIQDEPS